MRGRSMQGLPQTCQRQVWVLLAIMLVATLALPAAPTQAAPRSGETFTVDTSSNNTFSNCSPTIDNDCSLRGAISRANATTTATIIFDPDVSLIALLDPLPAITGSGAWIL